MPASLVMDLNLRLLRSFVTVVDEGHFARAAARLFITPPALTQQIRRLEREVGLALLDRAARPVTPTPAGEAFLVEARSLLEAAERASAVALSLGRIASSRFALGYYTTPLGRHTRSVLDGFTGQVGRDSLKLVELAPSDQTEAVRTGRVDASLVIGPVLEPRLRVELATLTSRVLLVAADHRLAGRPSVRIAETSRETHVTSAPGLFSEAHSRWWLTEPRPNGVAAVRRKPVNTLSEALEEVAIKNAVLILPQLWAESFTRADLAQIPVVDLPPSEMVLCTRPDDTSPMTALMRRLVAELAAKDEAHGAAC